MIKEKFAGLTSFIKRYPIYMGVSVAVVLVIGVGTAYAFNQNPSHEGALDSESIVDSTDKSLTAESNSESLVSELQSSASDLSSSYTASTSSASTSKSQPKQQQAENITPTNTPKKITMFSKNYNDTKSGSCLETNDWIYVGLKRYSKDMSQMYDFYPLGQYAQCTNMTVANNKIYFSASVDLFTENSRSVIAYCDETGNNTKEIIKFNNSKFFTIYKNRIYYVDLVEKATGSSTYNLILYSTDLEGNDKKVVAKLDSESSSGIGNYMTVSDGYFFLNAAVNNKENCIIRFSLDNYSYGIITLSSDKFTYKSPIFAKENYLYFCNNKIIYRMKYDGSQLEAFADFNSIASNTDTVDFAANDNGFLVCTLNCLYSLPYTGGTPVVITDYFVSKEKLNSPATSISLLGTTEKKAIVCTK